jgi:hypothetical protein
MEEEAAALARYLMTIEGTRAVQTCEDLLRTFAVRNDDENSALWMAVTRHVARLLEGSAPRL